MATTTPRRRSIDTAHLVEIERDRDRTRKNMQGALERAEQYRRHLEMCDAVLAAFK